MQRNLRASTSTVSPMICLVFFLVADSINYRWCSTTIPLMSGARRWWFPKWSSRRSKNNPRGDFCCFYRWQSQGLIVSLQFSQKTCPLFFGGGAVQSMLESLSICALIISYFELLRWRIAPAKHELVQSSNGFYQYSTKQFPLPTLYNLMHSLMTVCVYNSKVYGCVAYIHIKSFQDIAWPCGRKGMGPTTSWEIVASPQGAMDGWQPKKNLLGWWEFLDKFEVKQTRKLWTLASWLSEINYPIYRHGWVFL